VENGEGSPSRGKDFSKRERGVEGIIWESHVRHSIRKNRLKIYFCAGKGLDTMRSPTVLKTGYDLGCGESLWQEPQQKNLGGKILSSREISYSRGRSSTRKEQRKSHPATFDRGKEGVTRGCKVSRLVWSFLLKGSLVSRERLSSYSPSPPRKGFSNI